MSKTLTASVPAPTEEQIVTLASAGDTGLVPDGWTVESDQSCEIDLVKLDYSYCPVQAGEPYIVGDVLLKRATEQKAVVGLGFGKLVLDAQKAGKDIIPVELRGKIYIPLTRTILRDRFGGLLVAYLDWLGSEWYVDFGWLDDGFGSGARLVRASE